MSVIIDKIVDCIKNNYIIHNHSEVIEGNDRSVVANFPMFVNNVLQKLGNDFELYKKTNDFVVFKKDGIYILIDYDCVSFRSIDFNINMFDTMTEVDRYFLSESQFDNRIYEEEEVFD
jgi:hypothetical protein